MNWMRWSRIGVAGTAAVAALLASTWIGDQLVPIRYPAEPAYDVPGVTEPPVNLAALQREWPEGLGDANGRTRLLGYMSRIERGAIPIAAASAAEATAPAEPPPDLGTLLAAADAAKGERTARVCMSCHTFEQGGPNRVGPNLWAVVGRDIGSHAGFNYSTALRTHPGNWTYDELDRYLASPARAIPGNKMAFAGLRKPQDRANLLAYLRSLSPTPVPFPPQQAQQIGGPGSQSAATPPPGKPTPALE